jgi:predicted ferric reductase
MMDLKSIVQILQIGFAGFAFLMAGLSFRLLLKEQHRETPPRKAILDAIRNYMRYTLVLCLLVILAHYGEALVPVFERRMLLHSEEARTCRDGLERLIHAGGVRLL